MTEKPESWTLKFSRDLFIASMEDLQLGDINSLKLALAAAQAIGFAV
jgi:hypothetical protein